MRRAVCVLLLLAGLANSAIVDSSKSPESKNVDWDDEDSMTLVSTTTTTAKPILSSEDQITEEQQRPRFISLIPPGTHNVNTHSQSDQEGLDQIKYRINPKPIISTTPEPEQDDGSSSEGATTPGSSSSEEASESPEQSTTEGSRIKHVQLGKIPLTFEIIPLLPPREEKQQLLGRDDTKPVGFFPTDEMMTGKPHHRQQHSTEEEDTTEIIMGKPVPDLQELPGVPLTYMVPPQRDGEIYWRQYPEPTTTINFRNLDVPQTSTINPLLERINELMQKAKRHSLETETTTGNGRESTTTDSTEDYQNTERVETTTSAEEKDEGTTTTTEKGNKADNQDGSTTDPFIPTSDVPEDSNGDLNPSSPAPVPEEPTEEIITTRGPTILYPRPNIPEVPDYSPESQPFLPYPPSSSPLPPPQNSITLRPSMDQYFSDYNNFNNYPLQQQQRPYNPYYYPDSDPSSFNQRRVMISSLLNNKPISTTTTLPPPPSRPMYISPDSYWPQKYYNNRPGGTGFQNRGYNNNNNNNNFGYNYNNNYDNNNYNNNPYTRSRPSGGYNTNYDYYLRPQRQAAYAFPTTSTQIPIGVSLNSILASSEEPSYGPEGDLNDLGTPYYAHTNDYYPSTQSSPYVLNYRPMIPYRRTYPISSSDLVNDLMMYAPLYPYQQYRRSQVQQQPGYY